MAAFPSFGAELSVQYELIARSGVTPIPDGDGAFTGFSIYPAIDSDGNVVFTAAGGKDGNGNTQSGIYTYNGTCCQKVADRNTLVPGGGGVTFDRFIGSDLNDIDNGRVAFRADVSPSGTVLGLYSNAGQPGPNDLVEVALIDGTAWDNLLNPWVDGDVVAAWGLLPSQASTILRWDGVYQSSDFVDAGTGFNMGWETQASISGDASIFIRYKSGATELAISHGVSVETLAVKGSTPIPGHSGVVFSNFGKYPVVDNNGQDAAFRAGGGTVQGVYKRVNGGSLQKVADDSTVIPGAGSDLFSWFNEDGVALANGQVLFLGVGQSFMRGIYTDIGGSLALVVDDTYNNTIDLDGQTVQIDLIDMGHKSFAYTPQGYMVVFQAGLASGGSALIRATISVGQATNDQFTVYKDFSDNSASSVSVSLSCSSGTVTNNPQNASEASPAVFSISGAGAGATCTATETVPSGYTADQSDCQDGDPLNGSCTIVNDKVVSSHSFTVYKDFSDNNSSSVSVSLNCSSGSVTNNPQNASESSPAVFNISGASNGATCTATENVPSGYTADQSDCQDGDPLNGSCTIVNNKVVSSDAFTVYKDFSDNNTAAVSVSLTCSSGTVTNSPQNASESAPAVFNISGASAGATCTATENVPSGYTADQSDCQDGDPINSNCTIVNNLVVGSDTFRVFTYFDDKNPVVTATVYLTCSSGTVTNNPQISSDTTSALFNIEGASPGATCTATENPAPSGYTMSDYDCQRGDPLNSYCVIFNDVAVATDSFTVYKDFSDDNSAAVSISLSCSSGTVTNSPQNASEASPAVFNIEGAAPGASCTASENAVPSGYTADESDCQNGDPLGGNCTIVNTLDLQNGSFTVYKDFSDDSTAAVSISLSCSSGTVTNSPQNASEASPAVFNIEGAAPGASCTASENAVPSGYTADESDCQNGDPLGGNCTIVNTLDLQNGSFTVYKDFSDDSTAAVSISLSCSSGTVTNSPQNASEASPAVFNIEGAAPGASCTASENAVPSGYTADESDCQNGDPVDGFCTIINSLDVTVPPPEDVISESDFEEGHSDGWQLNGNVSVDGILAIGQYSLRHQKGNSSEYTVSTSGYENVKIMMHLAATSLKKNDRCSAEVSVNDGNSWMKVVEIRQGNDNGVFLSGTVSPSGANDNAHLRLRFLATGKGKGGGYCYGDEVMISGTEMSN